VVEPSLAGQRPAGQHLDGVVELPADEALDPESLCRNRKRLLTVGGCSVIVAL
jgi:hypothetical protein